MQLTVSAKSFLLSSIWIIITICEVGILHSQIDNIITVASYIILFNLIAQFISIGINNMSLVSFFSAFVLCYYLMHFGQVLMMGFFPDYTYDYTNYISVYMNQSSDAFYRTIQLCIVCINMFFAGGILTTKNYEYTVDSYSQCDEGDMQKNTAFIIFCILLPFRLYIDIKGLIGAMLNGYYGAIDTSETSGVVSELAIMWYVALILYYLEIKDPTKKKRLLIAVIIYLCFTMLTGKRGHVVVGILALLIAVIQENKIKFKLKNIILFIILGYIGLTFIDVIFTMRLYSISYFISNISAVVKESTSTNILLETIGTFGETLYTPYLVMEEYGKNFTPFFGECFIKSLVSIVPDAFGWFKDINNQAIFQKMLDTSHAIGGSFAGEMYYNFGKFYPLMSALFGGIISRLSSKSEFAIKSYNYEMAIVSIIICSLALWWVRDSIGNMTRGVVWMFILYFLIDTFINRRGRT